MYCSKHFINNYIVIYLLFYNLKKKTVLYICIFLAFNIFVSTCRFLFLDSAIYSSEFPTLDVVRFWWQVAGIQLKPNHCAHLSRAEIHLAVSVKSSKADIILTWEFIDGQDFAIKVYKFNFWNLTFEFKLGLVNILMLLKGRVH